MVYAIIEDGGKQYKVAPGDMVHLELRNLDEGQQDIEFENVLFYHDDETILTGTPILSQVRVKGKIAGQSSGPKLHPMHFKRRKNERRRIGHRQKYLAVEITEIAQG